VKLLSRQ